MAHSLHQCRTGGVEANVKATVIRHAGYSCRDVFRHDLSRMTAGGAAGCSAKNLVDAGCSAKDLSVPVTAERLKALVVFL